jgi:hypothetical protein
MSVIAKTAAESAAKSAAKTAAESAVKTAAESAAKSAAKTAAESAAKTAAESAAKTAAESAAKTTGESAAKSAAKKVAIGGLVAGAGYVAIDPAVESNKKNGSKYGISAIVPGADKNTVKITFSPGQDIYIKDQLTFSGTNSVPNIDGLKTIFKIIDKNNVVITNNVPITKNGTTGTITLNTTYANQQALLAQKGIDTTADLAGGGAGFVGDIVTKLSKALGINFTYVKYGLIAIATLIVFGILFKIYSIFFRPSRFGRKNPKSFFGKMKTCFGRRK